MTPTRLRRLYLIVALLCVLAAAAYSGLRFTSERHVLLHGYRSGTWIAVQAEAELLSLQRELARYAATPSPQTYDRLLLRFDLFWSRIPLILKGEEGAGLRDLPHVVSDAEEILDSLPQVEALIGQLDGTGSAAVMPEIESTLAGYETILSDLTRNAILQDAYRYNRKKLSGLLQETMLVQGLLALLGTLLIAALWRQLHTAELHAGDAKRARQAADAAHQQLADAIAGASEGILLLDADGKVISANPRYLDFYPNCAEPIAAGATFEELIKQASKSGHIATDKTPQAWAEWRLRQTRRHAGAWEQTLQDGRVILVSERETPSGGLAAVHTDITELKQHAAKVESLKQELAELVAAVDAADIGIMICDVDSRDTPIRQINEAFTRITQYEPADVIGHDPRLLQGPETDPAIVTIMREARVKEEQVKTRVLNYRKDGTWFWNDMTLVPMRSPNGQLRAWVGLAVDASEAVTAERERTELVDQFYHAQKMEAVGRLASGVAHDLNNVLAVMVGFGSLLRSDLTGEAHDYADRIVTAGERGKAVVARMLSYARHDKSEQVRTTDLVELVRSTTDLLRAAITYPAEIRFVQKAETAAVQAKGPLIEQALMNLCVNARDALPDGSGLIRVAVEETTVDGNCAAMLRQTHDGTAGAVLRVEGDETGGRLWLGMLEPGRYVRIDVADTGSGMSSEVLSKIFDPFYTTKTAGAGTGLGMSSVRQVILQHGGAVDVTSRVGVGTTVSMFLPLTVTATAAVEPTPVQTVQPLKHGEEAILLVDDETDLLECNRLALERLGYTVFTAENVDEALTLYDMHGSAVVAAITDYAMPRRTGLDLARELHRRDPLLAIILCSGCVADIDPDEVDACGIDCVISKPLSPQALAGVLGEQVPA